MIQYIGCLGVEHFIKSEKAATCECPSVEADDLARV